MATTGDDGRPVPAAFVALTRSVTGTPLVRPVTIVEVPATVAASTQAPPPTEVSTRYEVIGAPPVLVGADQVSEIWASPREVDVMVGALGTPIGVAVAGTDAVAPTAFSALTRNA